MGCLAFLPDEIRLYYLGWNLVDGAPFRNRIGLAVSRDGGRSFRKPYGGPVLDLNADDPQSLSYPWVMHEHGVWRMWYGSVRFRGNDKAALEARLRCADSADGINWTNRRDLPMPGGPATKVPLSRPCIVRDAAHYRMWYSRRPSGYRIDYAESADGWQWVRRNDGFGLDVAASGWDSESVEYACIFDQGGARYMLYNGNGYGRRDLVWP